MDFKRRKMENTKFNHTLCIASLFYIVNNTLNFINEEPIPELIEDLKESSAAMVVLGEELLNELPAGTSETITNVIMETLDMVSHVDLEGTTAKEDLFNEENN